MKFLITGGSGFIGEIFSCYLLDVYGNQENEFVFLMRNRKLDFLDKYFTCNIEAVKCDLLDFKEVDKLFSSVDIVIHMAAKVSYGGLKESYYQVNFEATKHIFQLCLKKMVKKVIYLSTAAIYHPAKDAFISDKFKKSPVHVTHYTKSKYLAHGLVKEFRQRGLNIVTLMPSSVFGYQSFLFEPFIKQCLMSKLIFFPKYGGRLSLIFPEDVAKCMMDVITKKINNNDFFISDTDFSLYEIALRIRMLSGRKNYMIKLPNFWVKLFLKSFNPVIRRLKINMINYELFKFIEGNLLVSGKVANEKWVGNSMVSMGNLIPLSLST